MKVLGMEVLTLAALILCASAVVAAGKSVNGGGFVSKSPTFERIKGMDMRFGGTIGDRISANQRNWLLTAPASNPGMLQILRDRDKPPARDLYHFIGEFPGKYLTSATECYRITKDPALRKTIETFAADLISAQADDGYIGPFPKDKRMLGRIGDEGVWDLWGQYHCMLGLYTWYVESGDKEALAACRRTADFFCKTFLDDGHRVMDAGYGVTNESCIHIFTLLYEVTGEPRYLQLAHEIEKDFETPAPPALLEKSVSWVNHDYIRASLDGKAYSQLPYARWEGLHALQGVGELYYITGDERYRKAFEQFWWGIAQYDVHNTGGFSSWETAVGDPYNTGPIETCCTVAWMALSVDMLRMSGDSRVADELELSTWNGMLGAQSPSGRWWTYDTPMNGLREAASMFTGTAGQARPGMPEVSCCAMNGPRGIGMLSEWAVMSASDGIVLNYYGQSTFTASTPSGGKVHIEQKTDYPVDGRLSISVNPDKAQSYTLYLRIPSWSRKTSVRLNRANMDDVVPGKYLKLARNWKPGDKIELTLDMSPRLWVGEKAFAGQVSVYHGPILLAYDRRFDTYEPDKLPMIDLTVPLTRVTTWKASPKPMLLLRFGTKDGKGITLCDFASAGNAGTKYISWLPASGEEPVSWTRENLLRSVWP